MSTTEILTELPNLSAAERRAVAKRLFELDPAREELEACAQATDLAFQELDRLEAEANARPTSR
jgi:hypothetical protein